ncbi:DUF1877 family protein [Streptomyces sp. NPDC005009]
MDVIHGEEPFAEDEDWGYGPQRYLRSERVQLAAEALRATRWTGFDPFIDGCGCQKGAASLNRHGPWRPKGFASTSSQG